MTDKQGTTKRRPRFSLLNLLLVMTIAAMAVALWRLNEELAPLKSEVRRLRNETGQINIDDPGKCYAVRIETHIENVWRWRVWIPEGSRYRLKNVQFDVPAEGIPDFTHYDNINGFQKPGEYLLTLRLDPEKHAKGDVLDIEFEFEGVGHTPSWGPGELPGTGGQGSGVQEFGGDDWVINDQTQSRGYSIEDSVNEQVSVERSDPLVLFRLRAADTIVDDKDGSGVSWSLRKRKEPCPGLMLWLEPEKKP